MPMKSGVCQLRMEFKVGQQVEVNGVNCITRLGIKSTTTNSRHSHTKTFMAPCPIQVCILSWSDEDDTTYCEKENERASLSWEYVKGSCSYTFTKKENKRNLVKKKAGNHRKSTMGFGEKES
ncbi:hypothetical protein LXL04_012426 [Taraxacum kok-saghyz]